MYGIGDYIGDSYSLNRMATEHPAPEQFITIPEDIAERARTSLTRMFELEKIGKNILNKPA